MTKYLVTCETVNCENQNISIEVPAHIVDGVELDGMNAICGACSNHISNIQKLSLPGGN
jgi:hypothetical protein